MAPDNIKKVGYTTSATAEGGREGRVHSADGVVELELARPDGPGDPVATPETLFAAAWAGCFNGAVLANASRMGLDATGATVTVTISHGKTENGFGIAADIVADLPESIGREQAEQVVARAHEGCPYSKATRGNIPVTVRCA